MGPMNRIAVKANAFAVSIKPMGKKPMRCKDFPGPPFSAEERKTKVMTEQMMHDTVTECIRPRITDGASRDSVIEGRVVEEM